MTIERREKFGPVWLRRKVQEGNCFDLIREKLNNTGRTVDFLKVEVITDQTLRLTGLNSQNEEIPDSAYDLHGEEINQLNIDPQITLHRRGFFVVFGRGIIFRWKPPQS